MSQDVAVFMFLEDTFLNPEQQLNMGLEKEPEVGHFGRLLESFFSTKAKFKDPREERIEALNVPVKGEMSLYFDSSVDDNRLTIGSLTEDERNVLFNIIERLYLTQNEDTENLNEEMSLSESTYKYYVEDSLFISTTKYKHKVSTGKPKLTDVRIPSSIIFKMLVNKKEIEFKVWLSSNDFKSEYPLSIISDVVLPCNAKYLLNPSQYKTIIDAITLSGKYTFDEMDRPIEDDDHSGLFTYMSKYVMANGNSTMMPFGILYKGKLPSTLEMRKAIRDKLEAQGIAPKAAWEGLFPELYVNGQFYIIPIWDNYTKTKTGKMYPAIINHRRIRDVVGKVFPSMDPKTVTEALEILGQDYNEVTLASIPDPLNVADKSSLLEIHPTFVHHSPQSFEYGYMEKHSQEFNIKLNRCVALLFGTYTSNEFVRQEIDGLIFYTFVVAATEYYLLAEESFPLPDVKVGDKDD